VPHFGGSRFHGHRGGSRHEELLCNNWNQVNFPLPSYPLTLLPSVFPKRLTFFPPFAIRYY
jgi:hypothetical protein